MRSLAFGSRHHCSIELLVPELFAARRRAMAVLSFMGRGSFVLPCLLALSSESHFAFVGMRYGFPLPASAHRLASDEYVMEWNGAGLSSVVAELRADFAAASSATSEELAGIRASASALRMEVARL